MSAVGELHNEVLHISTRTFHYILFLPQLSNRHITRISISAMSQITLPEDSTRGSRYSAKIAKVLAKIDRKAKELRANGIHVQDLEKVKSRLSFAWCEKPRDQEVTAVTTWRDTAARTAYAHVQDANSHLLLPVILAVSPSECSTIVFKGVLQILLQRHQYTSYRLSLSPEAKMALKSLAIKGGFSSNARYHTFLQSLFPERL